MKTTRIAIVKPFAGLQTVTDAPQNTLPGTGKKSLVQIKGCGK